MAKQKIILLHRQHYIRVNGTLTEVHPDGTLFTRDELDKQLTDCMNLFAKF